MVRTTGAEAKRFRVVATVLIVLVTAAICYGAVLSRSAAGGARLTNVFSSGPVAITGCSAVFGARDMAPGQTVVGAVVVSNDGGAPGCVWLGAQTPAGRSGQDVGDLARTLRVVVTEVGGGTLRRVYCGTLAGLSAVDLGTFAPRAVHAYRLAVTLPWQAATSVAGDSLSVTLRWTTATSD